MRIGGSSYIPFENPKQLELRLDRITKKAARIKDPYEQSLFFADSYKLLASIC